MPGITVICVGKLKESFYISACAEYVKRISGYASVTVVELPEAPFPDKPSPAQIAAALGHEADSIIAKIPKNARVTALCVEGSQCGSEMFARKIADAFSSGAGSLCYIIGGSNGLHDRVKALAADRLSLSEMTFPHHLTRVTLLEQLYRAFNINAGGKYHK